MKDIATTTPTRVTSGLAPFASFRREIDRLFDEFGGRAFLNLPSSFNGLLAPEIDYAETDADIVITAELPGVDQKDVDVAFHDDTLTIRGEKKSSRDEKKENYRYAERTFGSFERSIVLPPGIDASQARAEFGKGVLKITMPKPAGQVSETKKIAIKAAS